MLEASFPPSEDTIAVAMAEVPAFVDEWTVRVLARLTAPAEGVSVALAYDLPGAEIELTNIEHTREPSLGPYELDVDSCHEVVIAECQINGDPSAPLAYEIARLTFALTPSDTARVIQFAPAVVAFGDVSHTSVVSRLDAMNGHIEGWAPKFVNYTGHPGTDSYGHLCLDLNRGDVNMDSDEAVDITDLSILVYHLFINSVPDIAVGEADVAPRPHPDGILDITDLQVLIDHLFLSLEPLPTCYD
jgi:hypothetical protein